MRLSPNHDNLLHAILAVAFGKAWANDLIIFIHSVLLMLFALAGVFALGFGMLTFIWWFAIALMLSHLTTIAEQQGEYRRDLPQSQLVGISAEKSRGVRQEANIS